MPDNPCVQCFGFTAVNIARGPRPLVYASSTRLQARDVREFIGKHLRQEEETLEQGWRRAYRKGWRIMRVRITTDTGDEADAG